MRWKLTNYVSHTAKLITGETNVVDTKVVSCRKKYLLDNSQKHFLLLKHKIWICNITMLCCLFIRTGEYNNIIIMIITLLYTEFKKLPLIYIEAVYHSNSISNFRQFYRKSTAQVTIVRNHIAIKYHVKSSVNQPLFAYSFSIQICIYI